MSPTRRKESLVWFAAYGSNLMEERFLCYIRGGTPRGATQGMAGCSDPSPPRGNRRTTLPYRLYFAGASETWSKGGVAYLDPRKEASRKTHGRLFLITQEQFAEVFAQVNSPGGRGRPTTPSIDFAQLGKKGKLTVGKGWYDQLISLGEADGHPIITMTSAGVKDPAAAPDHAYLRTLLCGILEMHNDFTAQEFEEKLSPAVLAKYVEDHSAGTLDYERISSVVADALIRYPRVEPTRNRAGNGRQFIVQPTAEFLRRFSFRDGDRVLLKADHGIRTFAVTGVVNTGDPPADVYAVRVDAKLRVAVGLEPGDRVHLVPVVEDPEARKGRCCENFFRLQPQLMRAAAADLEMEETGACRIPAATLGALGVKPGGFVRVHVGNRWVRIPAVEMDAEARSRRERQIAAHPDVVPDPVKELHLDRLTGAVKGQDLPPVYLDAETCRKLEVRPCDPVRVVRDSYSVWMSVLGALTLPFILALVGAAFLMAGPVWVRIFLLLLGLTGVGWGLCLSARERVI